MALQASFGFALFHFLVASDAGRMGGSVRPWNHLLMDDVAMTVDAFELRLLDVQSMGHLDIPMNLFRLFLDVLMTVDAALIDEFVLGKELVGKNLIRFRVTVDTGHPRRVNRLGPHHDSGLLDVAVKTYARMGHENMSRRNDEGYPQNHNPREDTEEKPSFLNQIQDGALYEISDFHGRNSSSMVLRRASCPISSALNFHDGDPGIHPGLSPSDGIRPLGNSRIGVCPEPVLSPPYELGVRVSALELSRPR